MRKMINRVRGVMANRYAQVGAGATVALLGVQGTALATAGPEAPDLSSGATLFGSSLSDLESFAFTLLPYILGLVVVVGIVGGLGQKALKWAHH